MRWLFQSKRLHLNHPSARNNTTDTIGGNGIIELIPAEEKNFRQGVYDNKDFPSRRVLAA